MTTSTPENYNSQICDLFRNILEIVVSFDWQVNCTHKRGELTAFKVPNYCTNEFNLKVKCLNGEFCEDVKLKYVDGVRVIKVILFKTIFYLPNNSYTISEIIQKLSGKSKNLTLFTEVKHIKRELFEDICTLDLKHIKIIKDCKSFLVKDSLRPTLECLCIDSENIVATDSHRLSCTKHSLSVSEEILIPINGDKF